MYVSEHSPQVVQCEYFLTTIYCDRASAIGSLLKDAGGQGVSGGGRAF